MLSKGTVRVYVYEQDSDPKDPNLASKVLFQKTLEPGSGFGELALIYNSKRTATIRAESDEVLTYALDGGIFKTTIVKSSIERRNVQFEFLNKVELFDGLDRQQKNRLTEGMKTVYLKKDQFVIKEGDHGEDFFVIEDGEVDCLKLNHTLTGEEPTFTKVRSLSKGDHFGELALLNSQQRSLSIRVSSEEGAKLQRLDKDTFIRILGSIEQFLKKDYNNEFEQRMKKSSV